MTLVVDHLYKRFGTVVALDDLTFEVAPGQVFGFLGANGAGKTTTMRITLGVLEPDAGQVTWRGAESHTLPRSTWGYLPEERGLYPRMRVMEQLVFFAGLHGVPAPRAKREATAWLRRFRAEDLAERRAEQLSKGNQQKVQFIAAVLHDPQVLLMDEPFTGLDPVNVMLLREAFLELRDRGRTVVFSTHQMEVAEALCESLAIVDRGRVVVGGSLRDVRRSSGRRMVVISVSDDHRLPWLSAVPGARIIRPGIDRSTVELEAGVEPEQVLAAAVGAGARVVHFEIADPSLEQIFIEHVGRPADDEIHLAPPEPADPVDVALAGAEDARVSEPREPVGRTTGSGGVANAALIAKREYIERVRSRAFVFSTLLLAGLAVVVALIPLGVRLVDRATVTRVAVVAPDTALGDRAVDVMDQFLNARLGGEDEGVTKFTFELMDDPVAAAEDVRSGALAGAILIERTADGGLDFRVLSVGGLAPDRAQLLQIGTFAVGILDWTAAQPPGSDPFVIPGFEVVDAGGAGVPGASADTIDAAEYASRRIVGIVFVVLSFLTLVFYGLWVASGVVAEKAGRVMELLISAATAPQLVTGKIAGIGLAGLTQVSLVLLPAIAALLVSGELANRLLGPAAGAASSLSGLSPGLVAAFLVYFVLGFALYAAMYAAAGSMLSRAEDLQIVALPLSIPAVMGYFPAVLALSGATSGFIRIASYIPLWSPFVMMSRLAVGNVAPWELALSIGLLAVTVPIATLLAIRVYRAGVLMYGQPPTVRTFMRAIRG